MNKNKKSIVIFTLIIVIIFVIILFVNKNKNNISEIESENNIAASIIIRTQEKKYNNDKEDIDIKIPEIQNLDMEYERYINSKIYKDLNPEDVYKKRTEGYESGEIGFFTYETSYERYNSERYISIVANQYIHLGDGRPRTQKKCYVIDAEENYSPSLTDVFENKFDYKKAIIDEINRQAAEMNIELVGGNGLTELSETQAYYIKDNKIVIYFESSEIAAAAVGELEFIMPFEMKDGKFILEIGN